VYILMELCSNKTLADVVGLVQAWKAPCSVQAPGFKTLAPTMRCPGFFKFARTMGILVPLQCGEAARVPDGARGGALQVESS
jgi:hypothetical protein